MKKIEPAGPCPLIQADIAFFSLTSSTAFALVKVVQFVGAKILGILNAPKRIVDLLAQSDKQDALVKFGERPVLFKMVTFDEECSEKFLSEFWDEVTYAQATYLQRHQVLPRLFIVAPRHICKILIEKNLKQKDMDYYYHNPKYSTRRKKVHAIALTDPGLKYMTATIPKSAVA